MHRPSIVSLACCAAFGLATSAAQASDNDITTSFSGYGTVEGAMSSNHKYEYINSSAQFKGASDQLDIGGESRLGLQGTVNFGSQLSITAQALASRVGSKDFDINTEWLFAQYEPMPGLDFRLGRVVMPTFLFSDTRNVGYSQTWQRSPNEVYALMPFKTLDGAQASWRAALGPVNFTSQVSTGKTSAEIDIPHLGVLDTNATHILSLAFTAEYGDWTARVSETRLRADPLPVSYTINDKFITAGMQYDNGHAIVLGEWARRTENDIPGYGIPLIESTSWYLGAGWRFDKLTPMLRYSRITSPTATGESYAGTKPTVGASLRYDVYRNVALKAQVDRYDAHNTTAFVTADPGSGTKVTVMSVGADFVF